MLRPFLLSTLLAGLLALAALPTPAAANAMDDRIARDCLTSETGRLRGKYTRAQLRHALRNLDGDVLEYSGCWDAINDALRSLSGGRSDGAGGSNASSSGATGGGGTSGGSDISAGGGATGGDAAGGGTPAAGDGPGAAAHSGSARPVQIAGTAIEPGRLPPLSSRAHTLPGPLIALLAVLGAAALVPAVLTIGRRVIAGRRP